MENNNLMGGVSETVEHLVELYVTEFGYTPEQTQKEILENWEMDERDIEKALLWLRIKYAR